MKGPYCFDTSAWLEFFNAGPHGPRVRDLVERHEVLTPAVVVAELIEAARRRHVNTKSFLEFLESRTTIVTVTADVARAAGRLNAAYSDDGSSWSLIESLVLATARGAHARLVTRDPIYEGLSGVEFLGVRSPAAAGATA